MRPDTITSHEHGSKLFLNDVEKITTRIGFGALVVVLGTIAISFAKV